MSIKIRDLKEGDVKSSNFLVKSCNVAQSKRGPYLRFILSDGKSDITGFYWDYDEDDEKFIPEVGSIINVNFSVDEFNDKLNLKIRTYFSTPYESADEFRQYSPIEFNTLQSKLNDLIEYYVTNPVHKFILCSCIKRYPELMDVPAAKSHHHDYLHGTLEHSLEVATLAVNIAKSFFTDTNRLDLSLIATGSLLHDLGKARCYYFNNIVPDMTDLGKYIDHLVEGVVMLREVANSVVLPSNLDQDEFDKAIEKLSHIIASHHENLEWGSPVKPCFPEALIVARADNLSYGFKAMCNEIDEQRTEWASSKSFTFGTYLHKDLD